MKDSRHGPPTNRPRSSADELRASPEITPPAITPTVAAAPCLRSLRLENRITAISLGPLR